MKQQVEENLQKNSKDIGNIVSDVVGDFLSGKIGVMGIWGAVTGKLNELEKKIELEGKEEQKQIGDGNS